MTARTSQIGKDTARTLFFSILANIVSIATGIVIAKGLGPSGKGIFSGVQLMQGGVIAITGGVGAGITYLLAKQRRKLQEINGSLASLVLTVSAITGFLLTGWALIFGFNTVILIVMLIVPPSIIVAWQPYYYMGLGRVRNLNYQSFGLALGTLAGVAIAIYALHLGIVGALVARCLFIYIAAAVVVSHAINLGGRITKLDFGEDFKQLMKFGLRSGVGGVLGFLNYRIDSLILIAFLGAAGFGVYSVAIAAGELLLLISRAVSTATSHAIGTLERGASVVITAKAARTSTFVMTIVAIPLILVAPPLMPLVYGPKFIPAGVALMILLPGTIAFASGGMVSSFLVYQLGRPIVLVFFSFGLLIVQAGACLLLIPRLGMNGAAIASTITNLSAAVIRTWYFCHVAKVRASDVWLIRREDFAILSDLKSLLPASRTQR